MVSSAGKTTKTAPAVQQKAGTTFFRKAGEASFFGAKESPSFFGKPAQAKLTVSTPDDPHEKEADAVAEKVMRMPDPVMISAAPEKKEEKLERKEEEEVHAKQETPLVSKIHCKATPNQKIQAKLDNAIHRSAEEQVDTKRSTGAENGIDSTINRKNIFLHKSDIMRQSGRGPPANSIPFEQTLASSKGGGSALPGDTRTFMENRFNADFSGVRVHTNSTAEHLSSSVNAQAFAHGNDIYFNKGKFSPNSTSGGTLLAHELTHTIQQGASKSTVSPSSIAKKNNLQRKASGNIPIQRKNAAGSQSIIVKSPHKQITAKQNIVQPKHSLSKSAVDHGGKLQMNHTSPSFAAIQKKIAPSQPGVPSKTAINLSPDTHTIRRSSEKNASPAGKIVQPKKDSGTIQLLTKIASGRENTTIQPGSQQIQTKQTAIQAKTALNKQTGDSVGNPPIPQSSSPDAGNKVLQKKEKDDVRLKQEIPAPQSKAPSKEISVSLSPDAARVTKPVVQNVIPTIKILQPKADEPPVEKEKQLSETEADVHIRQKTITGHGRQIQACECTTCEQAKQVQAKENQQESYTDNSSIQLKESNIAASERGPPLDRGPPLVLQRSSHKVQRSIVDDVISFAGSITDCIPLNPLNIDLEEVKHCAKGKAQQVAMHIPGYKALRVVLGEDPITGEGVARSGRNFIEAAFDLVPGGDLLHKKLDEIHKLDAAAAWIDQKIETVTGLVRGLKNDILNFWKGIHATDITSPMDVLRRGVNIVLGFIGSVKDFAINSAKDLLKMVKDFLLDKIVDFIKTQTTAYPLLTVILGKDPITDKEVARNGTNILNALLDLGGDEGKEQKKQMLETGTFKKAADFIDEGIKVFSGAYQEILDAFHNIWNEISISSLMDPSGTFSRIYNGFAAPIRKVWDFIKKVGAEILKFIKTVLMTRLSAWAKTVRGYFLVTVIIGKDPFTSAEVPRTVENIIHGFMSLMDGGEEQFKQMKESGAIAKAEQKINAAVKRLNMTPQAIVQLFIDLWNSFSIQDLAHPIAAFQRIIAKFGEPIARLVAFVIEIIKIVVEVILIIMQFPFDLINNIIAKAMQAYEKIKSDPIGFLKNLLRAIKEGFVQFFGNILKHLLAGLTGWLMSELKDANVKAPKDFTLGTIIGWVLDLLGISMEKIWKKLAEHPKIGPARVAKIRGMIDKLEGIWTFIKDVQERGMAAIWDKIVEKLNNLWDTVLDSIKNWIMEQIVNKMVTKLLSMLDPTGIMAVVNSAIALYKAVQSFMKYLKQMLEIVNSFVEGVVEIANGNTKKAANFLEATLARGVPIVIGFLANQIGLSGVGKKVGEMIEKVRDMVDKALTWLVNKAVDTGINLIDKVVAGGKAAIQAVTEWWKNKKEISDAGETHNIYFNGSSENGDIMIASDPKSYIVFVNEFKVEDNDPGKSVKEAARVTSKAKYNELEGFKNKSKNKNPKDPADAMKISQLMDQLAAETKKLIFPTPDVPESTPPVYGAVQNGFGMKAQVNVLTLHVPGGGSDTDSGSPGPPAYESLNKRYEKESSKKPFYLRGHLLNSGLGGPGTDWRNLVPLTTQANKNHSVRIEQKVKNKLKEENKGGAKPPKYPILKYSVEAIYGGQPSPQSLIDELNDSKKTKVESDVKSTIIEILNAEQHVPTAIKCTVKEMDKNGNEKEIFPEPPIDNHIRREDGLRKYYVT